MFALIDCNSFFASCEKVFRPRLAEKPVVVLSNNDGIVIARSPEAKKIGIPMGEAFFKIKRLAEQNRVSVFSSNFELYADMSRRVMQTLEQWTSKIEIYSIDEAFLDLDDLAADDLNDLGQTMATTVRQWTGIPVSVGIAATKTLAKAANETAKSRGVPVCHILNESDRISILKQFNIADVWGVGRRLVGPFRRLGLHTAFDLSEVDPFWIRKNYSIFQEKIVRELRGEKCFDLDTMPQPKQSIQVARSFGETTDRLEDLKEAVATFAANAAAKARGQDSVASAIYVHVRTSPFRKNKEEYYSNGTAISFPIPTASTPEIIQTAHTALQQIFVPNRNYKKAMVILLNLLDADAVRSQGLLFEMDEDRNSQRREIEQNLMNSIDQINRRLGKRTVFFGAEGVDADWRPHRDHVSACFTTRLRDLPVVK